MDKEIMQEKKENIRFLVRSLYDFQSNRIRTANRLKKRKDDSDQNVPEGMETQITTGAIVEMVDILDNAKQQEADCQRLLKKELKGIPIYEEFLKDVKGCGPTMAGVIVSEFDINIASTRSKMWQYAGLNPSLVNGKKRKGDTVVVTDNLIRGDKLTAGYISPYNTFLKSKLLGVLADCFIKSKSSYTKFYYNMKQRLSNSDLEYKEGKKWKDETKAHIDMASKRYMIKMFLGDLYEKWRALEGLEVRVPYEEEYLGRKHHEA